MAKKRAKKTSRKPLRRRVSKKAKRSLSRKASKGSSRVSPKVKAGRAKKIKIGVIGIGGGGSSIVSELATRMKKASFVVANTDTQALKTASRKAFHFQFGGSVTRGLGTGMNPDLGREAAQTEKERIKKILEGQDLCILIVSLGGGAGSGAAPVFAKISQNLGNITYGIFTLPFKFEGEKKIEIARNALKKLKPKLNLFSVIPNERIFQMIDKRTPLKTALSAINKNLAESLEGLIEVIYKPGLINIDFADFKTVLSGLNPEPGKSSGKLAYLNTVSVQRKGRASENLIEKVLNNPLCPYGISGAKGVLLNIAGEKNLSLAEVSQISKTISRLVDKEAKIIFGISQSKKYTGTIKTTLLATGCRTRLFPSRKRKSKKKTTPSPSPSRKKVIISKRPKTTSIKRKKKKVVAKKTKKPKTRKRRTSPKIAKIVKVKAKKVKRRVSKKRKATVSSKEKGERKQSLTSSVKIKIRKPPEVKVRKNALQIKKEAEAEEKEILAREKFWETPAFLRRKIIKEK